MAVFSLVEPVILDCHPVFTMLVILCGWVAKTAMAATVSKWVGGDDTSGEAWLAYSIPSITLVCA